MDDDVAPGKRLPGSYLRTDAPRPDQADEKGRVAADMTHEEMSNLKKGDRFQVLLHGTWQSGTFHGTINGADAAMWFAYDYLQQEGRGPICTKIYTGLQFKPEYWDDPKAAKVFRWPSEADLNEELLEKMGVES